MLFLVVLVNVVAIGVAIAIGIQRGDPVSEFDEDGFITMLSVAQLLIISALSFQIWRIRGGMGARPLWRSPSVIWGIIGLSFAFLAADDLFMVHERADRLIHRILNVEPTPLTHRLDDCFVGLYGLTGLAALVVHRDELRMHRGSFRYFAVGFFLMFTMVVLDLATNGDGVLVALFGRAAADFLVVWLAVAEDASKVLAEALFIVAFHVIWRQVRPGAALAYQRAGATG